MGGGGMSRVNEALQPLLVAGAVKVIVFAPGVPSQTAGPIADQPCSLNRGAGEAVSVTLPRSASTVQVPCQVRASTVVQEPLVAVPATVPMTPRGGSAKVIVTCRTNVAVHARADVGFVNVIALAA